MAVHNLIFAYAAIGVQPCEVGGQLILLIGGIGIAVGIHLKRHGVAHGLCRAARAATLVEYRREIFGQRIVEVVGTLGAIARAAGHTAARGLPDGAGVGLLYLGVGIGIRIGFIIYGHILRADGGEGQCGCGCKQPALESVFHICI